MTEQQSESSDRPDLVERAEVELVDPEQLDEQVVDETVDHPAKVMRIGAMMKQLLEELRTMELDEPSRHRLRDIYETSVNELGGALSPDLREELDRLSLHLAEAKTIIEGGTGARGRKLEFTAQEIGREINTTGSKSQYYPISRAVIEMKTLLDQFKEQVANIE